MNQARKEKIALGTSVLVLGAAVWFWATQIVSVVETLKLASG
ncbi:MAG: hypothetical protein ACNA7W_05245 [Pseudomonadales bacterium]